MTARETAERHAPDVVDGNFARPMGDFETRWEQFDDGLWKVVKAQKVDA